MDELDEKLGEIIGETEEYEKIKSELGDSYIASGEAADDELESIIGEFGSEKRKAPAAPLKDGLSTDELRALSEGGKTPSPYKIDDSATVVVPDVKKAGNTSDLDDSATVVFAAPSEQKKAGVEEPPVEYGEKDEAAAVNERIMREKEEKFFGKNSKLRDSVFNWEKDKDLKTPSKESAHLPDGQVSFLSKDETEQDRKITGYFTDVYDVSDVAANSKRLKEQLTERDRREESDVPRFSGIIGKLFNEPESNEEPVDEEISDDGAVEDYESGAPTPEVANDLVLQKRQALFRIVFAAAVSLVLLIIDFIVSFDPNPPALINYIASPVSYGIATLLLTAAVIVCGIRSFISGLTNLFTFKPSNDTAPALALIFSIIGTVTVMVNGASAGGFYSFAGVATICFTINLFAKYLRLKTVADSFETVSAEEPKHVVIPVSQFPGSGAYSEEAAVMKTDFVKGFMDTVTSYDGTERRNILLVPIMLAAVVISTAIAFIKGLPAALAVTFGVNAAVLTAAFVSPLSAALPIFFESSMLKRRKAAVLSLKAADSVCDKNKLVVRDTELFEASAMKIKGMKVFNESEIYETILSAAALYTAVGGPAAAAFSKMLEQSEELPEVKDLSVRDGIGVTAEVGGRRLYSGIPSYIESLRVDMHGIDLKSAYQKSGGRLVAIADDNRLLGVFLLSYTGGRRMKNVFRLLSGLGMSLVVCSDDPNISVRFIRARYKTDFEDLSVSGSTCDRALFKATCDKTYIPARIVSNDGPLGVVQAMVAAIRERRSVRIGDVIRLIAVASGAFVAIFLAATGSLEMFGVAAVMLFQAIWLGVLAAVTFFRL